MNLYTIKNKIHCIFILSFVSLFAFFIFLLNYEKNQYNMEIIKRYKNITSEIMKNPSGPNNLIIKLEKKEFLLENNPRYVLENSKIIHGQRMFELLEFREFKYFHFKTRRFKILFKDTKHYPTNNYAFIIFIIFCSFLLLIYYWILKSLEPLSALKRNVSLISKGDLNISCKTNKKDEVSQLANEFDTAIKKIDLLLKSRQLFLRTIMHELKTPLAKARIVTELLVDEKQKNRLINIHEKMDYLINDFAQIEQIISNNYSILKQNFTLYSLIKESEEMLFNSYKNNIKCEYDASSLVLCDYKLFVMLMKNLIDNALKYSTDKKVIIKEKENSLLFISSGEKLQKPLEEYFKAFHNDTQNKNHGMGLGLYIVKTISDMHDFEFSYSYINYQNTFIIKY